MSSDDSLKFRLGRDDDAEALIGLIRDVYAEYPGCILDVPREEPELLGVATAFANHGGQFWVATQAERIVGCLGYRMTGNERAELKKLYVERTARRRGIARGLMSQVEEKVRAVGNSSFFLWTDSRFVEAHAFYEALGYVRTGRERMLHDLSDTTEYEYVKSP